MGFQASKGEVVITMDADMQDSPDEIPELYRMIQEEGYDLVSGWKKKRHDPISKTIPSKFFNFIYYFLLHCVFLVCINKGEQARKKKTTKTGLKMLSYLP